MKKVIVILIAFALMGLSASSQTNVSGGIYSNTTWTLNNSPYIVTDTVVVFPNVTLTIEPGVVVKFDNNQYLEIRQAQLIANGTSTDSITFTSNSNSPTMGIYPGIYLNGGSMTSSFNFCNFYYATNGLNVAVLDSIIVNNSFFTLDSTGMKFIGNTTSPQVAIIDSNIFNNNNNGLDLENLRHATIDYCDFSNNSTYGFILGTIGFYTDDAFAASTNYCNFSNNGTGLIMDMDTAFVNYCTFTNNTIGFGGGTNQPTNFPPYKDDMSFCTFENNQTGLSPNHMVINNCTVNNNQTGFSQSGLNFILNTTINSNNVVGISTNNDSIANCNISYNGTGIIVLNATKIYGSTIENNTNANIKMSGSFYFEIVGNIIRNSLYGIEDTTVTISTNLITQNIIENNNLGILLASPSTTISCNLICNNTTYDLKYEGISNIDASHNYWCTTDSASTRAEIYDGYTNINYGLVLITPFDTNGCDISTEIPSISASNSGITVFPNPASTLLNIHNSTPSTNQQIIIIDILGNEIFSQPLSNSTQSSINISTLSDGVYFYEVRKNNETARGKFIKMN